MNKNKNENKQKYIEDTEFFTIWIYLNGKRILGKDNLDFYDLLGIEKDGIMGSIVLFYKLKELNIKDIQGIVFDNEIFDRFGSTELQKMLDVMQEYNLIDINKSLNLIIDNKFSFYDILRVAKKFPNILNYFSFDSNLSKDTKNIIQNYIKKYIEDYMADELSIDDKNYWLYEQQKKTTIRALLLQQEKYGNDFIIEYPKQNRYGRSQINNEYLFIHTLCALENLGYLNIEKIWINQYSEGDKHRFYKVKIHLSQKISEEKEKASNINTKNREKIISNIIINKKLNKLDFNPNTGDFILNKVKGNFPPSGQEYKVFYSLLSATDHKLEYHTILEILNWTDNKTNKESLSRIIRNIKNKLGILPEKKQKNKDIFENFRKHGYRLNF